MGTQGKMGLKDELGPCRKLDIWGKLGLEVKWVKGKMGLRGKMDSRGKLGPINSKKNFYFNNLIKIFKKLKSRIS